MIMSVLQLGRYTTRDGIMALPTQQLGYHGRKGIVDQEFHARVINGSSRSRTASAA